MSVIDKLAYANEYECNETFTEDGEELNMRCWKHVWCAEKNNGELASLPTILGSLPATVPNLLKVACEKHADTTAFLTRPIDVASKEGKKIFWKKGEAKGKTFKQAYADISSAAQGLLHLPGIRAQAATAKKAKANGDGAELVVAVLAETSAEWQISAQAALAAGLTITTVYATLGHKAMVYGLHQTEAKIIFVDWMLFNGLREEVLAQCESLDHIVLIGEALTPVVGAAAPFPSPEEVAKMEVLQKNGGTIAVHTLPGLLAAGSSNAAGIDLSSPEFASHPDDLALIMYTSGSTGLPKGVKLTHANFVAVIASALAQNVITPQPGTDSVIAYLPLAHILELIVEVMTISQGGTIAYSHARTLTASSPYVRPGDMITADMTYYRPTVMAAVPAILDMIKAGLSKKLEDGGGLPAKLFFGAVARKLTAVAPGGDHTGYSSKAGMGGPVAIALGLAAALGAGTFLGKVRWWITAVVGALAAGVCAVAAGALDRVIIKKVKKVAGLDRVRVLVSGGAPLSAATHMFCQAVFCPVAQGYGATETTGCATVQEVGPGPNGTYNPATGRPSDISPGRVGSLQPATQMKLLDVPEMKYMTADKPHPRGEILLSGANVTLGYYKLPEKTAEDFKTHADGSTWFHTGDVGEMCADGVLRIIDRKKDLVKLSGGEYVSLGKVEANLKSVKGLAACSVFAQGDKDHCVVIVSQPEKGWGSVGGKPDEGALLKDILAAMTVLVKADEMAKFEVPRKVKVVDDQWLPDGDPALVTAAFKIKRNEIRNFYNELGGPLDQMGYRFPEKK